MGKDYASQVQLLAPEGGAPAPEKRPAESAKPEVDGKQAAETEAAGGAKGSDKATVDTEAEAKVPDEELEVPELLNKKNVESYFNQRFAAEVQSQGIFESFFNLSAEVKNKSKPDKGVAESNGLSEMWTNVAAALMGHKSDVREFSVRAAIKTMTPAKGKRPPKEQFTNIRVRLNRRKVEVKENAAIEKTLEVVDGKYCYDGGGKHRLAPETYEAYKAFYNAIPGEFIARDPKYGKIMSSFRSSATQEAKFNQAVAKRVQAGEDEALVKKDVRKKIAAPGGSAHETGHGMDLWVGCPINTSIAGQMKKPSSKMYKQHHDFFEWVQQNAPSAGLLPYSAEPWHWEKWR